MDYDYPVRLSLISLNGSIYPFHCIISVGPHRISYFVSSREIRGTDVGSRSHREDVRCLFVVPLVRLDGTGQ